MIYQTALSDIEVDHQEREDKIYTLRYPLVSGDGYIEIATTRPETFVADTAVAVHPDDPRYRHLIGASVRLPFVDREIPIVADELVELGFGTGAVKVTPAHDPTDFEIAQHHSLPMLMAIDENGRMTQLALAYHGLDRFEARTSIVTELQALGNLVKVEIIQHAVGHCTRCEHVIEPLLSEQWFVRMEPFAKEALAVLQSGELTFVPERFAKIYINWMTNVRDWCISRQLWWGHQIPGWNCQICRQVTVSVITPDRCEHCGATEIQQEEDVLDTWFSSGLWPLSTMGWPDETQLLQRFYPTSVLVTGYDIIFFWVARMVIFGHHFTGKSPFRHVLLHGLVRDAQGRKMSKSLGNGVDPLAVIHEYGADALRFALITGTTPGNDSRFQMEKVTEGRNFTNKVWNAARFVQMNLGEQFVPGLPEKLEVEDRYIIGRQNQTILEMTRLLDRLELGEAMKVCMDFIWGDYCDWYIEMSKPRLRDQEVGVRGVLLYVLERSLRMLHPLMPFLSEAIWQRIPHQGTVLAATSWPEVGATDETAVSHMQWVMEVIRAVRNMKAQWKVPIRQEVPLYVLTSDVDADALQTLMKFRQLAGIGSIEL